MNITKYFLYDYTNYGAIFVFDDFVKARWEASLMRYCIIDTNVHIATINDATKNFNNKSVQNQIWIRDLSIGNNGVKLGSPALINDLWVRKRELANLMYPCINQLVTWIEKRSYSVLNEFQKPMDDMLAHEINASSPDTGYFSPGVIEYANTLNITPMAAYTEIKLEVETAYAIKMRAYAHQRYFISRIRTINNRADANRVYDEIEKRLLTETMI